MAASNAALKRSEDLLLEDAGKLESTGVIKRAAGRPADLQKVVLAMGDLFLADSAPLMAKFNIGKIIHLLERPGRVRVDPLPTADGCLLDAAREVLSNVALHSEGYKRFSEGLQSVFGRLEWYTGRGGAFASINFEQNHRHALLVGPGAVEHRTDVRIGMTVLGSYTRFPDHDQFHSRVFIPLSFGEYRFGNDRWVSAGPGDVLFNAAGRQCAIRCTREPLVMLWCQIEGRDR
ncbi:dimethylsulfonioproprionate lyase family protein [Ensifer adhaerens]|uniref:dimethylsulfonioproprionate lyase family protein n=1 Tax=Ensifer adhaerens TaxID=106592 RepID=UPI000AA8AA80|nr:dimethylsulfonioproprionate lyase family protein [Ensifer adhaerens]